MNCTQICCAVFNNTQTTSTRVEYFTRTAAVFEIQTFHAKWKSHKKNNQKWFTHFWERVQHAHIIVHIGHA